MSDYFERVNLEDPAPGLYEKPVRAPRAPEPEPSPPMPGDSPRGSSSVPRLSDVSPVEPTREGDPCPRVDHARVVTTYRVVRAPGSMIDVVV